MSWSGEAARGQARRRWPRLLAVAGVLLAVVLPARPAAAHAVLVESQPATGAVLARAPQVVLLRFSEDVSARFSSASLLDGTGRPVAGSRVAPDRGGHRRLAVELPALGQGTYGVAWRAFTEDDGHTTSGIVVFTVGSGARPADAAALAAGDSGSMRPLDAARRWLGLCLLAALIGGLAFAGVVLRPTAAALRPTAAGAAARPFAAVAQPFAAVAQPFAAAVERARARVLTLAGGAGVLAALVGIGELVSHTRRTAAGSSATVVTDMLTGTRWGHLWIGREAALVALAAVAAALRSTDRAPHRRRAPALWLAAVVLITTMVTLEALGSHAMALESARGVAVVAVAVHTLTACVWLGGVAALALVVAPRGEPGAGREAMVRAYGGRFAALAVVSVGLVVATGLYGAGRQVGSASALVHTAYGRALLVKGLLLVLLGGLGLVNAVRLRGPAPARPAASPSRRLLVIEAGVGVALLFLAGMLVETAPSRVSATPRPAAQTDVTRTGSVADLVVSVSVTPNRPGANGFTIVAASGRRPEPAPIESVTLDLAGAAGTDRLALQEIEPGRYFGTGNVAGPELVRATVVVHRAGVDLTVAVEWSVPPAPAGPASPRDRFAPIVDGLALLVIVVMAVTAARWVLATRRRRTPAGLAPEIERTSEIERVPEAGLAPAIDLAPEAEQRIPEDVR
jgi:copper transport protein